MMKLKCQKEAQRYCCRERYRYLFNCAYLHKGGLGMAIELNNVENIDSATALAINCFALRYSYIITIPRAD
jgi:hypothetical protein